MASIDHGIFRVSKGDGPTEWPIPPDATGRLVILNREEIQNQFVINVEYETTRTGFLWTKVKSKLKVSPLNAGQQVVLFYREQSGEIQKLTIVVEQDGANSIPESVPKTPSLLARLFGSCFRCADSDSTDSQSIDRYAPSTSSRAQNEFQDYNRTVDRTPSTISRAPINYNVYNRPTGIPATVARTQYEYPDNQSIDGRSTPSTRELPQYDYNDYNRNLRYAQQQRAVVQPVVRPAAKPKVVAKPTPVRNNSQNTRNASITNARFIRKAEEYMFFDEAFGLLNRNMQSEYRRLEEISRQSDEYIDWSKIPGLFPNANMRPGYFNAIRRLTRLLRESYVRGRINSEQLDNLTALSLAVAVHRKHVDQRYGSKADDNHLAATEHWFNMSRCIQEIKETPRYDIN